MKGANEYAPFFKTGQYGKLYITSSHHAMGFTFRIQVLPENEDAIPNGDVNMCTNKNAVEVYGVITVNPGWTEEYGWLHEGKWQEDFYELLEKRKAEVEKANREKTLAVLQKENEREQKIKDLLSKY